MSLPKSVGIVYAFSEANHAVFQNAGMWALKHEAGTDTWGYAPREYLGLYWSMDVGILISPPPYREVRDVYETQKSSVMRRDPRTWFSSGSRNHARNLTLGLLPSAILHKLPMRIRHDFKSRKFLFDSGVFKLCKNHFINAHLPPMDLSDVSTGWSSQRENRDKINFLGTGMYRDLRTLNLLKHNLVDHFQTSFEALNYQLNSGVFAPFGPEFSPLIELQNSNPKIREIIAWMRSRPKTIFLRTRNINNNVRFQNAQPHFLAPLIRILIDEGVGVINSGIPPMKLDIFHENYLEFDHHLPIDIELSLSTHASRLMNTAWAGLFTAVSTLKHPLITFDTEWSVRNLPSSISLLRTRKHQGFKDINLGESLYEETPQKVAQRLLAEIQPT